MMMNMGWGFLTSQEHWADFFKAKFRKKNGILLDYYKASSIWPGLKEAIIVVNNSRWFIGDGSRIDFWRDCSGSDISLFHSVDVNPAIWRSCSIKLNSIIDNLESKLRLRIIFGRLVYGLSGLRDVRVGVEEGLIVSDFQYKWVVSGRIAFVCSFASEYNVFLFFPKHKRCFQPKNQDQVAAKAHRVQEKTQELQRRFIGDQDLDSKMPDLFEAEPGEPIAGMPFVYWWGVLQMMGPFPGHRLSLLESFAEEMVDQEDVVAEAGNEKKCPKELTAQTVGLSERRCSCGRVPAGHHDVSLNYEKRVDLILPSVSDKMHTRRASRLRLIDEEVEENEASVSGRALMDEGSDIEELVIAKNIPLAVVVPETGGSNSGRRKIVVTEGGKRGEGEQSDRDEDSTESDEATGSVPDREKQRLDRFVAKHGLSKVGVILYSAGSEYSFKSKPREGIMAYRGQIRLGMQLPFRRLVKEVLNFWEIAPVQMNRNFYEMMKEGESECGHKPHPVPCPQNRTWANPRDYIDALIDSDEWVNSVFKSLGIKTKRQKKTNSQLRNIPITSKPSKKRGGEGVSKVVEGMKEDNLARKVKYVLKAQRASKQAATVPEVTSDASRQRPKQASTQAEKEKGKVIPESPRVQQAKGTQRKRRRALGEDNAEDASKDMTEAEREDHALVVASSMAELCADDPDEASKQIRKSMYQQTDAWVQYFQKAVKVLKRKLQKAADSLKLVQGTEASVVFENKTLKRDLEAINDAFEKRLEGQRFNHEQVLRPKLDEKEKEKKAQKELTVRLKEFIEDMGFDPDTMQRVPATQDPVAEDSLQTEGMEVDVDGGGVQASVIDGTATGSAIDVVVDSTGSKSSTGGAEDVGAKEPVGGEGAATPI
ncbi:hypothetical protein GIB67_034142 [Kingdonia uniflora]|uniref:Uncharacterized protein n=1 Tax=Kingdonia uniflora TaxID=39325 RepID=A0A7J7P4L5_9MAGN|nr:hypothetical protein GIB67_034142 [Kingdonia uniflora]